MGFQNIASSGITRYAVSQKEQEEQVRQESGSELLILERERGIGKKINERMKLTT